MDHVKRDIMVQACKIFNHLQQRGLSHTDMLFVLQVTNVIVLDDADIIDPLRKEIENL